MPIPTTLAIDYGTRRIGLAVSRGTLAEPFGILEHHATVEDPVTTLTLDQIKAVCDQEDIEQIVVGISENQMAEMTLQFISELKKVTPLPVETFDETLSSHAVHAKVLHSGMKKSKRQQPVDHLAAAEFLQEWLDLQ